MKMTQNQTEQRINPEMPIKDAIAAMAGRNPGAVVASVELFKREPSMLMRLDTLGIYESRLYMLWNDVCERDTGKMVALLFAQQLGVAGVTADKLHHAIDNHGDGIDTDEVVVGLANFDPGQS